MKQVISPTDQRSIALIAIFQAADLAYRIAMEEPFDNFLYETSIKSIFVFEPENIEEIFPHAEGLKQGFHSLQEYTMFKQMNPAFIQIFKYALGLMHLQKKLSRSKPLTAQLGSDLKQCERQFELQDRAIDNQILDRLAACYTNTIGEFRYRIIVKGKQKALSAPNNVYRIRAIFLAGIRASMLWRQLGGHRWQLVVQRSKLRHSLNRLMRD